MDITSAHLKKAIAKDLDIEGLPRETQERIIAGLGESIMKKLIVRLLSRLTPNQRNEFDSAGENGNIGEAVQYLENHVSDFHAILEETSRSVVEDFKRLRDQAMAKI